MSGNHRDDPSVEATIERRAGRFEYVRVGDTVAYTSGLNQEYCFTVTEVDDTWITFQTGQQVHRRRFDRESFTVVSGEEETPVEIRLDDSASRSTTQEASEATAQKTSSSVDSIPVEQRTVLGTGPGEGGSGDADDGSTREDGGDESNPLGDEEIQAPNTN